MIDWSKVKPEETVLRFSGNGLFRVLAIHKERVFGIDNWGHYGSFDKITFSDSMIEDPWEEITDECEWQKSIGDSSDRLWFLSYHGQVIRHDDNNFKCDGRRVWKHKDWNDWNEWK